MISAIAAGGALACAEGTIGITPLPGLAIGGTLTAGVVIAGFTATQRNQILAMRGSRIIRLAANAGYDSDVLSYLAQGIYGALVMSAVSLLGFFVCHSSLAWSVWLIVWGGTCVWTAMALVRNQIMMSRIFARLLEEERPRRTTASTG